jgi:L-asparagine transporter-like permease
MWLFPWASYAAVAGMLGVLIAMLFSIEHSQELYFSLLTLVIVIAAFHLKSWRRERLGPLRSDGAD